MKKPLLILAACLILNLCCCSSGSENAADKLWHAPDPNEIPSTTQGELILYGKDLVINTAAYFGPKGKIAHLSNGLNCQNCHLDAGTRNWANNFSAVQSTYPRFHERSGNIQTINKKIKDCFERSMNGVAPEDSAREMKAIIAYVLWVGKEVPKNVKPKGCSTPKLAFLNRAANPDSGKIVYLQKCAICHGVNGDGKINNNGVGYLYPPLWGNNSYNTAASMFRLSKMAGFVSANMPLNAPSMRVTNEEAWDVSAYINNQPRPDKRFNEDWPILKLKPVDYPFGPYADSFSEKTHKFGPFPRNKE